MTDRLPLILVITGRPSEWLHFKREYRDAGGTGVKVDPHEFESGNRRIRFVRNWKSIEGYLPKEIWRYGTWRERIGNDLAAYEAVLKKCRENGVRVVDWEKGKKSETVEQ